MFVVYVLRNQSTGRLYTGYTAELARRLWQHNMGTTKSTKNRGRWEPVHQEQYATRAEAMRRERFLESSQGRERLKQLLADRQAGSAG